MTNRIIAGAIAVMALPGAVLVVGQTQAPAPRTNAQAIGREIAMLHRLADGDEYRLTVAQLVEHGRLLFEADWTDQEGGGRPLVKGTGRPLVDPSRPLTGRRAFNRISAPDANSCAGCHNAPYGIPGGGGDIAANVFVMGQRFDFITFDPLDRLPTRGAVDEAGQPVTLQSAGASRATVGMFGSGYLEMLARQITAELQRIRDTIRVGETRALVAKGISFGELTLTRHGTWDLSQARGLGRLSLLSMGKAHPPTLAIRPWHQVSNVISLRDFTNTSFNHHHGIQTTERFGRDTDLDGDGFTNEMSRAEVTAAALFQATMAVPGRVIPRVPAIEQAVLVGERAFQRIGCAACHVPRLPLDREGWQFSEPNPYHGPGNLRTGETPPVMVDLNSASLPQPRLAADDGGVVWVEAYTDFRLHNICRPGEAEPIDQNQSQWSLKLVEGNCRFLTKRLWGAANEPPYFHDGRFTTLRGAVLGHAGDAQTSRDGFAQLPPVEQDALIEFLKTLQVLPPGTGSPVVDEQYRPRPWPPAGGAETSSRPTSPEHRK